MYIHHANVCLYNFPYNYYFILDNYNILNNDISFFLKSLEINISNRSDCILARFLYDCHHSITHSIFLLFRSSFDKETVVPTIWKMCSVFPILKSNDQNYVLNSNLSLFYYSINLTLFEPVIYSNIKRSLNFIIDDNQH